MDKTTENGVVVPKKSLPLGATISCESSEIYKERPSVETKLLIERLSLLRLTGGIQKHNQQM